MLNQAREFNETVALDGLILTKLDGTARGGAVIRCIICAAVCHMSQSHLGAAFQAYSPIP